MSIAIRSTTFVNSGATGATSAVLAAPSGMTTGDLDLIFAFILDSNGNSTVSVSNDGTAFTEMQGGNANTGGNIHADGRVFRKSAAASPGSVTVSWTDSRTHLLLRMALTGVNLTTPVNVLSGSLTQGSAAPNTSPTFTIPGITTTADNCLAFAWLVWGSANVLGTQGSQYAVSGWTSSALNHVTSVASNNISGAVVYKTIATAGGTGDAVFDPANDSNTTVRNWIGGQFALAPDGGGGGPAAVRRRVAFFG